MARLLYLRLVEEVEDHSKEAEVQEVLVEEAQDQLVVVVLQAQLILEVVAVDQEGLLQEHLADQV